MFSFVRIIIAASTLLLAGAASQAATYTVNLNTDPGDPGTGGTATYFFPCNCQPSTTVYSQVYHFAPGDVVDFGSLQFGNIVYIDARSTPPNTVPVPTYLWGNVSVSYNEAFLPNLAPYGVSLTAPHVETRQLLFTIPDFADSIQIAWFGPMTYVPPVPEPATWAMLLIGFAGIGAAAYRRRCTARPWGESI